MSMVPKCSLKDIFWVRYIVTIFLLWCSLSLEARHKYVIVINPGHGGRDPGNLSISNKYKHEKDINLEVSLKLGNYLKRLDNVEVIYTRTTDKTVSLDKIVEIANTKAADFFVSIHCNHNLSSSITGAEVHIHSYHFKTTLRFASAIERQIRTRSGRNSLGIKDKRDRGHNLQVLQYVNMPGVLIELGFMSNRKEEIFLNSKYGQEILASAIYRGIRDFLQGNFKKESRNTYYKVQILASKKVQKNLKKKYKNLTMRIDEHRRENHEYKYYYTIGREYTKKDAKKLLNKIRLLGFKDSYIVKFKGDKKLN